MCLVALAVLVICLEAWRPPFPYRIGDFADHGIVARVDFRRVDFFATDRARSNAEAATPHVFRNDPKPLTLLPPKLRANLREIAEAKTVNEVTPSTRAAFGLTQDSRGGPANPQGLPPNEDFAVLRRIVTDRFDAPGGRIDEIVNEFTKLIEPLKNRGLADVNEFTLNKIERDQSLAIQVNLVAAPRKLIDRD